MAKKEEQYDATKEVEPPVLHMVRVRATRRGYDGLNIRNEDEVFELDVAKMKKVGPTVAPGIDSEVVKIKDLGEFILPSWVTRATKREPLVAAGHQTSFGNHTQNQDVI